MSNETQIELPFPLIVNSISAKYSETEKPSGLGYMLLKMIGSDAVSKEMTFRELIKEFDLPEDVFQIFRAELDMLTDKKMIEFNSSYIDLNSKISSIHFTKLGKDAFSKGVISKNPKDLNTKLYFAPGKRDTKIFFTDSNFKTFPSEFNSNLFGGIKCDEDLLEDFVKSTKSKNHYQIKKEDDIFDFRLESSELDIYGQSVKLFFDKSNSDFSLSEGDMDINFIKSNYSFDDIVSRLNPSLFETSDDITVKQWSEFNHSWNTYEFMLPQNFIIRPSDICLFNSDHCHIKGEILSAPISLQNLDSHVVVISSTGIFAYRFISGKVKIKGYDGQMKTNLIVFRSLLSEEKDECLKEAVTSINLDETDGLLKSILLCQKMSDAEAEIQKLMTLYLGEAPLQKYLSVSRDLNKFKKEKWYKNLPDIIELSLSERTDLLKDKKSIVDLLSSLSNENIRSDWALILPHLFSPDPALNLEMADYCLDKGLNKRRVIHESEILNLIIKSVSENKKIDGKSKFFSTVSNIRYNLAELQNLTGIFSLSEHSFDFDSFDEEKRKKIIDHTSTLGSSFNDLSSELKSLGLLKDANEAGLGEIGKFVELFKGISIVFKDSNKPVNSKDLLKEPNSQLFGIQLGAKLEENLKSMGFNGVLNEMLSSAHKKGYLSDADFEILDKFREFRNKCAHQTSVSTIDSKTKELWIRSVFRLESEKEGKK